MWAFSLKVAKFWGHSSVGRAPALQAGGRQFESDWLHQKFEQVNTKFAKGGEYIW